MKIKGLIDEDFVNYKEPSMFIAFSTCTWKCEKECNRKGMCQNSELAYAPIINIDNDKLLERFHCNTISKAIVFGGLEPMDSFEDMLEFIDLFRKYFDNNIVIYTGYYKDEISDKIASLKKYKNIIIKFGRFIPDQQPHLDPILGVELASDNQYAEVIS